MDLSKYLELFRQEAQEHLAALESFVASGTPADASSLQGPFRSAHSLKGMAAAMGFEPIQTLCHALEDGFARVRDGRITADDALRAAWVSAVSLLRAQLESEQSPPIPDPALIERLRSGGAAAGAPAASAPAPAPEAPAAAPAGGHTLAILHVHPDARLPAARALTWIKRLEALGTLRGQSPSTAEIAAGRFSGQLRVEVPAAAAAIRAALEGQSDLLKVEFPNAAPAPAPGTAEAQAPRAAPAGGGGARIDGRRLEALTAAIERLLGLDATLHARLSDGPESAELLSANRKALLELAGMLAEIRLVPFSAVTDRLKIAFQDVKGRLGKPARFEIRGEETVIDRRVLEELTDPLLHMLRNSLDHGLEAPDARAAAGKPAEGMIRLAIAQRADRAVVTLEDDGRGLSAQKLRDAAVRKGLITAERARVLSDDESHELITLPGFSTAETVTDLSGRGVGMDVVRWKIEALGGRLKIETESGRYTRFVLSLPVTALQQAVMLFEWKGRPFGLPVSCLQRAGIAGPDEFSKAGEHWQLLDRDRPIPVHSPGSLLAGEPLEATEMQPYLRLDHEGRTVAVAASRVIGAAALLVKSLPQPLNLLPGLAGAAILGDGRVAVMLDPDYLAARGVAL